jgi:hypothetical protein
MHDTLCKGNKNTVVETSRFIRDDSWEKTFPRNRKQVETGGLDETPKCDSTYAQTVGNFGDNFGDD